MSDAENVSYGFFGAKAHGPVLENKYMDSPDAGLAAALAAYGDYINKATAIRFKLSDKNESLAAVKLLTAHLNDYRKVAIPIFEGRDNSGQENLRSSILEEFFQLLLYPLTEKIREENPLPLMLGKANSYVGLTFTPRSFKDLFTSAHPNVHTKDQDFVLGCSVNLATSIPGINNRNSSSSTDVVVPVIAIECKTYIERNMLDSCAGTARRLKNGMPYCLYIVASEYMKMDIAYPELTDIDELFILTKTSNADRLRQRNSGAAIHDICEQLVSEIFFMAETHLNKIWWSPHDALARGRVIGRP